MNKRVIVLIGLLVLVGIIILPRYELSTHESDLLTPEAVQERRTSERRSERFDHSGVVRHLDPQVPKPSITSKKLGFIDDSGSEPTSDKESKAMESTGGNDTSILDVSSIYVIRSSLVLLDSERQDEDLVVLQQSLREVMAGMPQHSMVFDLDGMTSNELPFVIFAKDDYDITQRVLHVYQRNRAQALGPIQE